MFKFRCRFGTKSFLCAVAVVGILLAAVGHEIIRRTRESHFAETVISNTGGSVFHWPTYAAAYYTSRPPESNTRRCLRWLFGDEHFGLIRQVSFGQGTKNRDVARLTSMKSICDVDFRTARFSSEMARTIIALPNVKGVGLYSCTYSDAALQILAGGRHIERISIWPNYGRPIPLSHFTGSALRVMSVGFGQLDTAQLVALIRTVPLRMLHIDNCSLVNPELLESAPSDTLSTIYIRKTDMSALSASWVEQFPALRRLEVLDSQWSIDAITYANLQQRLEYCFVGETEAPHNVR